MKLRAVNDAGVAEREYVFGTLTENGGKETLCNFEKSSVKLIY